ncbi:hypothetical protein GCM10010350_71810 [Streptomyces galilaeus]|nr:hypothetical protein GCM10010350_71810 [Streptomyces galilaeus]
MSGTAGAAPMPEVPHPWDKRVKCQTDHPQGRHIVTRYGNSELGWHHFTGRHNIKKCSSLAAALRGQVDRDDHHGHLEYDGVVIVLPRAARPCHDHDRRQYLAVTVATPATTLRPRWRFRNHALSSTTLDLGLRRHASADALTVHRTVPSGASKPHLAPRRAVQGV